MLMKWEDLEPGDIIHVTQNFENAFPGESWTNKNLKIDKVHVFFVGYDIRYICIQCDGLYDFEIDEEGRYVYYEYLGQLFNIIKLRKEC